ncbi:MAG: beta-ketoacyl-[acyl-carrier-protein] synthase II, partial [Muribaculaceae bacterium]|nr:beta-ketoacyl-[acyl-carrier-protein] synthase II [Muribaculaceae bacterium]
MELKRVVVTGLGTLSPIGNDVATTWENAKKGVSGAGPITHFDASKFKTQFACEVKDFDPAAHFDRKKARQLDLYAMYALVAADEAIKDADLENEGINKDRVGVIFAAGIGGLHTFEEEAGYFALHGEEQGPKYNPFFIPKMIADIAAGQISIDHSFRGPNYGTVSACASSTNALIDAFNLI